MGDYELSFQQALGEIDPPPGIEVGAWRKDVLRLIVSHFSGRLRVAQIEVDDAVAEVLMGLVIRNQGTCAWHPSRGRSRSAYVYMVTEGVVNNMVRRRLYRLRHQVHTLESHHIAHAEGGAIDETLSKMPVRSEDLHQYLVEQQPARTVMDPVLLDDLDREFADDPDVRKWVHCTVNGMKRKDIQNGRILNSHRVRAAQKAVRRFLLE